MEVKVDFMAREVIKADSPATHDRHQLSVFDLTTPPIYLPIIFFYKDLNRESSEIISARLKSSLSKTLSRFYPLAGRIEGVSINCNNEGAVFTEAHTNLLLSDFLKNDLDNIYSLGEFFPVIGPEDSAGSWPLLSVQVSFLGSGSGVAVTVATSHKICDAGSLLTFAQEWAKSNDVAAAETTPYFAGATIYPPPDSSFISPSINDLFDISRKCVTNRFVFKSSKITELKRKAASESVPFPTRVEVITSLIWKCARNASRSNLATKKSTLMTQAIDLRLRIPFNVLPPSAIGNLQSTFFLKKDAESEMDIGQIVAEFRKAKEGVNEMIKESLNTDSTTKLGQNLLNVTGNYMSELKSDIDLYSMSCWCKKPFYDVDFGWGTPVWIASASHIIYKKAVYVLLLDSKDGEDVEAWIGLPKQDMTFLVHDQELLAYALLNPPVLI